MLLFVSGPTLPCVLVFDGSTAAVRATLGKWMLEEQVISFLNGNQLPQAVIDFAHVGAMLITTDDPRDVRPSGPLPLIVAELELPVIEAVRERFRSRRSR